MYFGYTHCPDICPLIINYLYNFIKNFKFFYKINFIFNSIDSEKDNSEIVQRYINKYNLLNWYAISLNKKFLEKISINFKLIYKNNIIKNFNKYKINHSILIYFFNKYNNINYIKN